MSTLEKIENTVVETVEDMAEDVKYAYDKVETVVVDGFNKVADGFVEKYLLKEGETVEEARERLAADHEASMKAQKEMIEKSIEASKNAGKR